MPAASHLQPQQLAMFIPAHELVESGNYDSVDLGQQVKTGHWDNKRKDNERPRIVPNGKSTTSFKTTTFNKQIAAEGVERPANIGHYNPKFVRRPEIGNGHHRIAALHTIDRNSEVPVIHHAIEGANDIRHVLGGMDPNREDDDAYANNKMMAAAKAKRAAR